MKSVRKISKKYYLRQIMACWLAFYMFFGMPVQIARAAETPATPGTLPSDVISSSGLAVIDPLVYDTTLGSERLDVTQADSVAIINWNNFDIGGTATVEFDQPGVTAAVLNRIHDGDVTGIMGNLLANGRVFIINPAGIVFGEGSQINVAQLTASSLDILDSDFLDGLPYKFDAGIAVGDIKNLGGNITATDGLVALIGRKIVNEGVISAEGGYVVMAAGDRVFLSESDGLVVEVEMDDSTANHTIHNDYDDNLISNADHVILAAGDIWTAAIEGVETLRAEAQGNITLTGDIYAYAETGSDAVADVTIITGGDLDIENDIEAVAVGVDNDTIDGDDIPDGIPDGDTYASITIEAAGSVDISSDGYDSTKIKAVAKDGANNYADVSITSTGGDVSVLAQDSDVTVKAKAYADEYDAVLNQANVELTGENVNIKSENEGWIIDLPDDALVEAFAHDGSQNIANVAITANGEESGNVTIESEGQKGDDVIVNAEAKNGEDNTAGIDISATGNVEVVAYGWKDEVLVKAEAWNDIVLEPVIPDPVVVEEIIEEKTVLVEQEVIVDLAVEGLTNTATVDITSTNGYVEIRGEDGGDAGVEALAYNDIKVNIENDNTDVTVNLAVQNLENTASVTIDADGQLESGTQVSVTADDGSSNAWVRAEAYNTLEFTQSSGYWEGKYCPTYYEGEYGAALNLEATGLDNTAVINISGETENVHVEAFDEDTEALVEALAYNAFDIDFSEPESSTGNLTLDGLTNTASIDIYSGDDLEVTAENGAEAGILVEAFNVLEEDDEAEGIILADNITNNSSVTVVVAEDVEVTAACEGEASDAYITADAWDETPKPDNEPVNIANTASVDITAAEDVTVIAEDGGDAYITAYAGTGTDNTANVTVNAGGEVLVKADGGYLDILQEAYYDVLVQYTWFGRTKTKWIQQESLDVPWWADSILDWSYNSEITSFIPSRASIRAEAFRGDENIAGVDIVAGDDVVVLSKDGGQTIVEAMAHEALNSNTANVTITTVGGDVKVLGIGGAESTIEEFTSSLASIEATAEEAGNSNTADVTITATATTSERVVDLEEEEGVTLTYVDVHGGDVLVLGKEGGDAAITAFAAMSEGPMTNTANVTIKATSAVGTDFDLVTKAVYNQEEPYELLEPAVYEAEAFTEGGDVKVIGKEGGEAEIEAIAMEGETNTADVLICIDGDLKVEGDRGGEAEIEALAKEGYSNTATVGIGARGDEGVEVIADRGGEAGISSKAKDGYTNTASTIVCTQGGVDVIAQRGGDAEILAQAKYGLYNDAYVGIGAWGDVVVQTGDLYLDGCDALIRAEAEMGDICIQQRPEDEPLITTADAEVVVFSHEGSVEVLAYNRGHSGIEAEAQGAHINTAKVGIAAAADLTPASVAAPDDYPNGDEISFLSVENFDDMLPISGNVIVKALGDGEAQIMAWAHDATSIYEYPDIPTGEVTTREIDPTIIPGENTADVVVCAPGTVMVYSAEGGEARIKSRAGWGSDEGSINKATTQIYASDVEVDVSSLRRGQGIWAWASSDNSDNPHVPGEMMVAYLDGTYTGEYYCMSEHGEVVWTDGDSKLIIRDYAYRVDCPSCPPCPCEEEAAIQLAAPLDVLHAPQIAGCPAAMGAVANELAIAEGALQISIGNMLALNPSIQPCNACAGLLNAAATLRDEDGSRMAALIQVFNEQAPANVPFSPAMAASIVTAFADQVDDGSQSHYATAMEYIDAFVQYVAILDTQLGSPVGDSTAFVMGKYGAGITESENTNIGAFMMMNLGSI